MTSGYSVEEVLRVQKATGDDIIDKFDNVVGTGVGVKMVDGQFTRETALILFVVAKVKEDGLVKLSLDQVAPRTIGGVPVDIIEVGNLVKHVGFTRRVRPISPGFSVSHGHVTAGTIGGIFVDRDGEVVILSNNHVLADENRATIGDAIYQPGIADMPSGYDLTYRGFIEPVQNLPYFARLKRFVELLPGGVSNRQDSAIAAVAPEIVAGKMLMPHYPNGSPLHGFADATPGQSVQKFGRTTGLTQGTVLSLHSKFTIGYDMGQVTFDDCIVSTSISRGGDSGSILLDAQMNALGLLFAGSDKVTVFHPIKTVADEYGLRPWAPEESAVAGGTGLDFWQRRWKSVYPDGVMTLNPKSVLIVQGPANDHAFVESPLSGPITSVSVDVFTGSDMGVSWGPGLATTFPNGVMKINARYNSGFAATWAGQEFIGQLKSSEPNRWYTLRLSFSPDWITADIADKTANNGKWFKVVELPANKIQGDPLSVRIGKMDIMGGGGDSTTGPGPDGRSQFANFTLA